MKKIAKLHFITQKHTEADILKEVSDFLAGGGKWVQLRMKDASDEEMIAVGKKVKSLCRAAGSVLVVNDRVGVAKLIGAEGVHLGLKDTDTATARKMLGPEAIIGRTANTLGDIMEIAEGQADYIGLGPYRFTTTKKNLSPMLGEKGYREIFIGLKTVERLTIPPIVATGGITLNDVCLLAKTGLHGLAVSSAISNASCSKEAAAAFLEKIDGNFIDE